MNRMRLSFGMLDDERAAVADILAKCNESYTGDEIWQRLNEAGFFIIPEKWLLSNVVANKIIKDGPDTNK
jgi:hypothetical protein